MNQRVNQRSHMSSRRRRRLRRQRMQRIIVGAVAVVLLVAIGIAAFAALNPNSKISQLIRNTGKSPTEQSGGRVPGGAAAESTEETTTEASEEVLAARAQEERNAWIAEADRLAAGYDYDKAIAKIQEYPAYDTYPEMTEAISRYEATKATCVKWPNNGEITHIFYHTLIVDTSLAFDGDNRQDGYNEVMTTIDEFNKITLEMYNRGYVLVSIHDIAHIEVDENGVEHMVPGEIWLPEGKKPYVLSQDDVSYYHYMEYDGFATKLVISDDYKPINEYVQPDGTVVYGSFDMVPLIDDFVEEHPDAAYRGARGIIALTGYNGILGYRTDSCYETGEDLDAYQRDWLSRHPDFDLQKEREEAAAVAQCMMDNGWEFASHSWGHRQYGQIGQNDFNWDSQRWEDEVEPLLGGDVDIIIFAFGDDIGDWRPYAADNWRFQRLKSLGFDYFCNVDSTQYYVQINDNYMRMGRRNLDGQRMWEAISGGKDRLSDLFNASEVFDPARPTPVPLY